MKNIVRAVTIAATVLLSSMGSTAFAADVQAAPPAGHFEWRSQPTYGPRSPIRAPVRVWLRDSKVMADCMAAPTERRATSQG